VGVARLFAKLGIAAGHFRDGQPGVSCGIAPDEKRGEAVPASDDIRTPAERDQLRGLEPRRSSGFLGQRRDRESDATEQRTSAPHRGCLPPEQTVADGEWPPANAAE